MSDDTSMPPTHQPIDFTRGPVAGDLEVAWIHGARPGTACDDPPIQVHRFDEHTYVLRQSKAATYEAPFLYLLFGNDRVLLFDTGAVRDVATMPLRQTIDRLVDDWLSQNPRGTYPLTVAHSHGHGDHVAGDEQFADRPDTVVVGREVTAVHEFFDLAEGGASTYDLGGRTLDVLAIPGHHKASIALFDPWTGWLLTGDTVYPGRLYVEDAAAFRDSLDRLVSLADDRRVTAVLGCHIEMTRRPKVDYPIGTRYQPDEPPLPMTVDQLRAVRTAAHEIGDAEGPHRYDDFALWVGPCTRAALWQLARQYTARVTTRVATRLRRPHAGAGTTTDAP